MIFYKDNHFLFKINFIIQNKFITLHQNLNKMLKVKNTKRMLDRILPSNATVEAIINKVVEFRKQQDLKRTHKISDYRLSMILQEKTLHESELRGLIAYNTANFSAPTESEGAE
jgi:hypothetical protein